MSSMNHAKLTAVNTLLWSIAIVFPGSCPRNFSSRFNSHLVVQMINLVIGGHNNIKYYAGPVDIHTTCNLNACFQLVFMFKNNIMSLVTLNYFLLNDQRHNLHVRHFSVWKCTSMDPHGHPPLSAYGGQLVVNNIIRSTVNISLWRSHCKNIWWYCGGKSQVQRWRRLVKFKLLIANCLHAVLDFHWIYLKLCKNTYSSYHK